MDKGDSSAALPNLVPPKKLNPGTSIGMSSSGDRVVGVIGDSDKTDEFGLKNRVMNAYSEVPLSIRTKSRERNRDSTGSFYNNSMGRKEGDRTNVHETYHPPYKLERYYALQCQHLPT